MRFANPLNDIARAVAGDDTALQRLAATPPTARDHVIISRLGAALSSHATRLNLIGPAVDTWRQFLLHTAVRRLGLNHALDQVGPILETFVAELFDRSKPDPVRGGLARTIDPVDAVVDARQRLVKPGGVLIPLRDAVFAAPVQAGEAYFKLVSPWNESDCELNMTGAAGAILNQGLTQLASFDRLLGPGRTISPLEYLTVESPNIDADVELPITEAGVVHGLSLWFETELVAGIGFSTAPDDEQTVYGRVFLPLTEPLKVARGDHIRASVKTAIDYETHLWVWRGRIMAPDGSKKASFASSTAFFNPESSAVREVFHEGCVPTLSDDGRIVCEVLSSIDGKGRVAELATAMKGRYPGRFEYDEDAVNFVRDVLEHYGETVLRVGD